MSQYVTLWHFFRWFSAFDINVVKRVSCGLMHKRNFMSCQWTLTIWSVPDCFKLFKTNMSKCWCGHSGVQTQQHPDSNSNSNACTEHNLSDCGSIIISGTGTGPTVFIRVSYVTGPVYIPDHPWPSWLYEYHWNANGNATVSLGQWWQPWLYPQFSNVDLNGTYQRGLYWLGTMCILDNAWPSLAILGSIAGINIKSNQIKSNSILWKH